MATVDFESLIRPVSADAPCGADLELNGDVGYMNFIAGTEGMLPKTFFGTDQAGNPDRPFDRASIDFDAQFAAAKPFLEQTRDLRLLGILAKLCILNRDLAGFAACVRAMGVLLETHWEDVHPRGEDGDFGLRMVAVEGVDAVPTVVMPLQFMPFVEHKRFGAFTYRTYMLAKGEVQPRGEEQPADLANVERILNEAELPTIVERRGQLGEIDTALRQIRQTWLTNCPSGPAATLERLPASVAQILALFDSVIVRRDPNAAAAAEAADKFGDGALQPMAGAVVTLDQAAGALAAVADYFSRREPSNPGLLLVRQAHALIGRSFLDALRVLVPAQVERAAFAIGGEQVFDLPIERLATFSDGNPAPVPEVQPMTEPAAPAQPDPAAEPASAANATAGAGAERAAELVPPQDAAAVETTPVPVFAPVPASALAFDVQNRNQAMALLDQVSSYLRAAEPSSPIPYLVDRARDLGHRDFLSVLKALLPADALRPIDGG